MSIFRSFALCLGLFLFSGTSHATLISIDSLTAEWINTNPVSGITNSGAGTSASIYWGDPATAGGQSGYLFETVATPIVNEVPPNSGDFLLGSWTHFNNPIYATTNLPALQAATLQLTANISADSSSLGSFNFLYDFTHHETPNGANPCANGGQNNVGVNINGCADIVDIVFNDLSNSFSVDGTHFTLNLAAGSSKFETIEKQKNTFDVFAKITASVPTPTTLLLFGLGLFGLGFARTAWKK